jgi:hypothetical protein
MNCGNDGRPMCYRSGLLQQRRFVRSLRSAATDALAYSCFCLDRPPSTWIRRWGWKTDVVDMPSKWWDLVVNYYVWLPAGVGDGADDLWGHFAVSGLGHIRGQRHSRMHLPWRMWSIAKSVDAMVQQICDATSWFDQFDAPSKCFDYLRHGGADPNSNVARIGSPFYDACEGYLSKLPDQLEYPACTIGQFPAPHEDGFRRLFKTPPILRHRS